MSKWTKKNFGELREMSPDDEPMDWRFARDPLESPELGVSRFTFEPGSRMPWGHRHREQEEAYVVAEGSGRFKLDDDFVDVEQWDVLRLSPEVARGFEAGPDGLTVICIGGKIPDDGNDGEKVDGFWDGA